MKLSDQVTVEIEPGAHRIFGKMPLHSSSTATFDLKPGQTVVFSVSISRLTGQLKIEPALESVRGGS